MEVNGFRDPSPWRQGEWWYTVLGSGIAGEGGAVLLYRSRDLRNWEYMHILARRQHAAAFDPFDPWETWECPEFFPLAGSACPYLFGRRQGAMAGRDGSIPEQ